jgi:ketol-acid reductoisomerase
MREAISNTAELGAVIGGPRIVDTTARAHMRQVLDEVRSGRFADALRSEEDAGYPQLEAARRTARDASIEQVRRALERE